MDSAGYLERLKTEAPMPGGEYQRATWSAIGRQGAVQLVAWHYPEGSVRADDCRWTPDVYCIRPGDGAYMSVVIGFHHLIGRGSTEEVATCDLLPQCECYPETDGWAAIELMERWKAASFDEDVIWHGLEAHYLTMFGKEGM